MKKHKPIYRAIVPILASLGGIALAGPALAAGITVGVGSAACPNATYAKIQDAVDAANPNDHIMVCPGTYTEQVVIPAGKDGLRLESLKPLQAVIQSPAVMAEPKAIVQVTGSLKVKIRQFTIQGPGGSGCDSIRWGVRVDGGGSAMIEKNHITHIRDNPLSGCQNGIGVLLGRFQEGETGSGTVKDNLIDDYQKGGVVVSNVDSDGHVEKNTIVGAGPTAVIAANGIQVSYGATASIRNNDVSDNAYAPQTVASTGILLYSSGDATIEGNDASGNDVGIYVAKSSSTIVIKGNDVSGGAFDGIDVVSASGVTVDGNKSHDNDLDGIYLNDTGSGNTVINNKLTANGGDGINVDNATNNMLRNNVAKSNAAFDCSDNTVGTGTAGTGNLWLHNKGAVGSPAGICKK